MAELHPKYRTYVGYARRDLASAINAGRATLRASLKASRDSPPALIAVPLDSRHRLDLTRNTLCERRPGPMGDRVTHRHVEIEWTAVSEYLRAFTVAGTANEIARRMAGSHPGGPGPNAQRDAARPNRTAGAKPDKREAVRSFISATYPGGVPAGVTHKTIARAVSDKEGSTISERTVRRARGRK